MTGGDGDSMSVIDARCSRELCLRNSGWYAGRKSHAASWLRYLDKLGYGHPTTLQRSFVYSTFGLRIPDLSSSARERGCFTFGTLHWRPFVVSLAAVATLTSRNPPVAKTQECIPPDVATIEAVLEQRVFPIGSRYIAPMRRRGSKIGSLYLSIDAESFVFAVCDWIVISSSLDSLIRRLRDPYSKLESNTDIRETLLFHDDSALACVNERLQRYGYDEFDEIWFECNFR